MLERKGIQERLRKLEKVGDITKVGDQAQRDSDRTGTLQAQCDEVFVQGHVVLISEAFAQNLLGDAERRLARSWIAKTASA